MINPSSKWTDKEIRDVILEILKEIDPPHIASQEKVYDVGERIRLLLTMPPRFLELNRASILKGQL